MGRTSEESFGLATVLVISGPYQPHFLPVMSQDFHIWGLVRCVTVCDTFLNSHTNTVAESYSISLPMDVHIFLNCTENSFATK